MPALAAELLPLKPGAAFNTIWKPIELQNDVCFIRLLDRLFWHNIYNNWLRLSIAGGHRQAGLRPRRPNLAASLSPISNLVKAKAKAKAGISFFHFVSRKKRPLHYKNSSSKPKIQSVTMSKIK